MPLSLDDVVDLSSVDNSTTPDVAAIEPLSKPLGVEDVIGRFPEPVYRQGTDTHLYALLQALCGDVGAGGLAKLAHYARYPQETSLIEFTDLDTFYSSHFRFKRLKSEVYTTDPDSFTTSDELSEMQRKDRSYQARFLQYMRGLHLGGTPDGITQVAAAATGLHVDSWEQYNYVFDQFSDDPLGIESHGYTASTGELALIVRSTDDSGTSLTDINGDNVLYNSDYGRDPSVTSATPSGTTRPALLSSLEPYGRYEAITDYASAGQASPFQYLLPELHHGLLDLTDAIKPVGSLVSLISDEQRLVPVDVSHAYASSEMFRVVRFVNGSIQVEWPDLDRTTGNFIQAGIENEALSKHNAIDWPTIFLTIDTAAAYNNFARDDSTYGTSFFYISLRPRSSDNARRLQWSHPPPLAKYVSYHGGPFKGKFLSAFAPLLGHIPAHYDFLPSYAVALITTPLIMTSSRR